MIQLTAREQEVADLLVEGLARKEIADALGMSKRTAETHLQNLYEKLGVHNQVQAAMAIVKRRQQSLG